MSDINDTPRIIVKRPTHILVYKPREVNQGGFTKLTHELSVKEKDVSGAMWTTFKPMLYDTDPKGREVLRLPAEVPDDLLHKAYPYHTITRSSKTWNARKIAVRFKTKEYPSKNDLQNKAFSYLAEHGQYEGAPESETKLLVAGTAAGKSYCSIKAWCERSDVLLGTFAQMVHLLNFRTELLKFTDLTEPEILVVDDGQETIRKIMQKPLLLNSIKVVLVLHRTIWFSMNACIEADRIIKVNEFTKFIQMIGVGTHIADEAHLEMASLIYLGMLINVNKTMYLSATPKRTDWQEDRVLGMQLPRDRALVIKSVPRLSVIQVKYNTHPDYQSLKKSVNRMGYFDINFFFDYLARPETWSQWEEMIINIINHNFNTGAISVGIVVSGKLTFLDKVIRSLSLAFPNKSIGNFSSRVPAGEKRDAELHKDIVVTTEKSFNGSVNPVRMTHLLLCTPLSSPVYIEQISGRMRGIDGNPCILIDMYDSGFDKLNEQVKKRTTTLKKLCTSLVEHSYQNSTGVTW